MQRNMDLVRAILLDVETNNVFDDYPYTPRLPSYSLEEIAYHVQIMADADLIFAHVEWPDRTPPVIYLNRMGWKGHEFLDAVRGELWWQRVRDKAKEVTGGAGLEIIKEFALALGRQALE